MHSLLKRQLKRHFGGEPPESVKAFLADVDAAYSSFDEDRTMIERSLELSSDELHQSSARLRSVLRAFPDLFFRVDADGRILDCKGGRPGDFVLPPEALIGRRLQDVPLQEAGGRIAATIALARRTGRPASVEYSLKIKEGEFYYEARLVPLDESEIIVIVRDITERRNAEAGVERSLALLRATVESTADGILVRDLDGRLLVYNRRFVELCRIPDGLLASQDPDVLLDWAKGQFPDPEGFMAGIRRIYANPEIPTFETLETKDGRFFDRYTQPYRQGGLVAGVVTSLRDVTERKRLERVVLQSEKMSAVGQLAAGVAHELNNPLGVILGFAQSLVRRLSGDGDPQSLPLKSIEREAKRCQTLIQQLLTFSRARTPGVEDEDLREVVEGALALVAAQAKVSRVALERCFDESVGRVPVDRNQIQQVVINLCANALDAMSAGGRLSVELRPCRRGADAGCCVELSVRDTGCGMSRETAARIFEPFFTTKEVGKGTGLGLALVHEIVKKHGGRIEVDSAPGAGTEFVVHLPRRSQSAPLVGQADPVP
ncbi:MAG: PAS domain-containing protein [Elusimicrobia bacterium]|nr:PAS domain-containing protein [Elusimicrobiota bacterium]